MDKKIIKIEKRIEKLKTELSKIGDMRPGSITLQYPKSEKKKKQGYYQISYTYKMKSRTEYIRPEFVTQLKQEVKSYKKFKQLTQKWVDLSIELSKNKIELAKQKKS